MMKTQNHFLASYIEAHGFAPTTTATKPKHFCLPKWRKRVDAAERHGSFTQARIHSASDWNLCALGEAASLYPDVAEIDDDRYGRRYPIDDKLADAGHAFYHAVKWNDFAECRVQLTRIEERLAELDAAN
jgi:hypothetical protein